MLGHRAGIGQGGAWQQQHKFFSPIPGGQLVGAPHTPGQRLCHLARQRLAEQRPAGLPPLQLCLQVNISGEASKSGLLPDEVAAVAQQVSALPAQRVRLRGLMAIPEPAEDLAAQRAPHRALRELLAALNDGGLGLDTLSMGMSADLEAAVAEGATIVRIGTAVFGVRA